MAVRLLWFRRDLRLGDNPALHAAAGVFDGEPATVLPVFVVDPALWRPAGNARQAYLVRSLRALDDALRERGGALVLRHGAPAQEIARLAAEVGADEVHAAADFGPYGRERDAEVEEALAPAGARLVRTGSPYAVAPGRVAKRDGSPYRVFTPFLRAWTDHGWRAPLPEPEGVDWLTAPGDPLPDEPAAPRYLPLAGEEAAYAHWSAYRDGGLAKYAELRDRADLPGTSRLSVHLRFGELHPRTLLHEAGASAQAFRSELCWREFYADVLWHHPESARSYLRPEFARMDHDTGDDADGLFDAWRAGRTGFPFVDAGMRQLLAEGWMHNRVRMVVASFLVKDLHQEWTRGAAHFMSRLADGDLASNSHGWQWVAGCGTDAAPYFRIFNPVAQGRKFDPDGDYVRRYVPELRGVPGAAVHEPWKLPGGTPAGYPPPVVDHAEERAEALARYARVRDQSRAAD
ncbi:cryptochrome/photolyase family protein [Yinghuangia seranimata]|uniref:cryptochrome/photolyase family protein n=1 Tax=Yinghuangia seranimata TaxID=408067 RepID=UPI00248BA10C|nr:deoxyribodipyrimidine photo-lyase [Yinghuangia seranimata]MDI2132794.1 deoxyribodipyrimidine photo-lyase [Yinghuangia seranimata]